MVDYFMSNEALLKYIGQQIRHMRINSNFTQKELAQDAGISRVTLDHLEDGDGVKLETLIRVLRALQKLEILNSFETQAIVSPLLLAQVEGKMPNRVSKKRK